MKESKIEELRLFLRVIQDSVQEYDEKILIQDAKREAVVDIMSMLESRISYLEWLDNDKTSN